MTTEEKIAALLVLAASGVNKVKRAEVLQVTWNPTLTKYYSTRKYEQMAGFTGIPLFPIEARLIGEAFREFEINPDIRTEYINLTFDDIDKEISGYFKTYKSGVRCELFYYWPDVDLLLSAWFGQLQAPQIYGRKTIQTVATNGFRSREQLIPKRMRPRECTANFGGRIKTAAALRTNGCPWDRHLGGNNGLLNGSEFFLDCPKDDAGCVARFGHNWFFLGFDTDATSTVSDANSGYVAVSKGNASVLKQPIRVIAGTKHVRGLPVLLSRREPNANDITRGFYAAVHEVGEGAVKNVRNIKVKEKTIEQMHLSVRLGALGQAPVANYNPGGVISRFSGTSVFSDRYGWTNPAELTPADLTAECDVDGFDGVAVYNPTAPGNGLLGTYYADMTFGSEAVVGQRIDTRINFESNSFPPFADVPQNVFSIKWEGFITFPFSETYTIFGNHDDGMKLVIDGDTMFDNPSAPGHADSGTFAATAGVAYSFYVEFSNNISPWAAIISWSSASTPLEVVPATAFTHEGGSGFIRQWTNDRVWWILEPYTNQRWGMSYDQSRVNTDSFVTTSAWGLRNVTFSLTFPDGETVSYPHRRTRFDAILEGRPAADQIEDICRSGAISVPFQHQGLLNVVPFRAATDVELAAARVFTDDPASPTRNIVWADGMPSIQVNVTPDDKLINEIVLTFEEASNFDTERPITVDDPNQKLKAGRMLGEDNLQSVPMRFAAFGIRFIGEVVKLGYRLLRFGQFDEGGTHNNCRAIFYTPYEFILGLKRYDIIRLESDLLEGHGWIDPLAFLARTPGVPGSFEASVVTDTSITYTWDAAEMVSLGDATAPTAPPGLEAEAISETEVTLTWEPAFDSEEGAVQPFNYFRILSMKHVQNGLAMVTAQAYNHAAYQAFEIESPIIPDTPGGHDPIDPPVGGGVCRLEFGPVVHDVENNTIIVPILPC